MPRIALTPTGPYAKWVAGYLDISVKAFSLLEQIKRPELSNFDSVVSRMFFDLSVIAEATSTCVRFAISHSLAVPAFALTRVRLEQCIISSFLVHAPRHEGISRYLYHAPIAMSEILKKYRKHVGAIVDTVSADREATQRPDRRGEFEFQRTWTPHKLPELARRRDELAKDVTPLPWRLEDEYWHLYPFTSLFVHAASEITLEQGEFHEPELGSENRYPYVLPERARTIMSAVAKLDVIQAYETVAHFGGTCLETIQPLVEAYKSETEHKC